MEVKTESWCALLNIFSAVHFLALQIGNKKCIQCTIFFIGSAEFVL